jgi:hypothetical protein
MIIERQQTTSSWHWRVIGVEQEPSCVQSASGKWTLFVIGSYHPAIPAWLKWQIKSGKPPVDVLSELWDQYDGHFAVILLDDANDTLVLGVDPYAIAKLYHYSAGGRWLIGHRLYDVMRLLPEEQFDLDTQSCAYYLMNGYTPALHTFYRQVAKVPPGTIVTIRDGRPAERCYLDLSSSATIHGDEYLHFIRRTWERSLSSYLNGFDSHDVALSGGVDSTLLLASLLNLGADRDSCMAKTTISIGGNGDIVLNPYDVDFAERVAVFYNIRHEKPVYNWSDKRVLPDYQRNVEDLGTECHIGAPIFQALASSSYSSKSCLYAAQNADSVFSFTATGWPTLKAQPPFVAGLGGWATRFNLFGGFDRKSGLDGKIAKTLIDVYLRRHFQVRWEDRTPEDRLFGLVFNSLKWPIQLHEQKLPYLADPEGLGTWFAQEYFDQFNLISRFAENPHGTFVSLFLHNFMQGADNRGTAWPVATRQMPTFLPFASLGILRLTTGLVPDSRFYWSGKFAVLWMARKCYRVPEWVIQRRDPPTASLDRLLYRTFFDNSEVYEFLSTFFPMKVRERFYRIVEERYLDTLVQQFEKRKFDEINLHLLFRISWLLTLEHLFQHNLIEVT